MDDDTSSVMVRSGSRDELEMLQVLLESECHVPSFVFPGNARKQLHVCVGPDGVTTSVTLPADDEARLFVSREHAATAYAFVSQSSRGTP